MMVTVPAVASVMTSKVIDVVSEQPESLVTVTSTTASSVSLEVVNTLPDTSPPRGAKPSRVKA